MYGATEIRRKTFLSFLESGNEGSTANKEERKKKAMQHRFFSIYLDPSSCTSTFFFLYLASSDSPIHALMASLFFVLLHRLALFFYSFQRLFFCVFGVPLTAPLPPSLFLYTQSNKPVLRSIALIESIGAYSSFSKEKKEKVDPLFSPSFVFWDITRSIFGLGTGVQAPPAPPPKKEENIQAPCPLRFPWPGHWRGRRS